MKWTDEWLAVKPLLYKWAVVAVAVTFWYVALSSCASKIAHCSPLQCEGIKDADRRHFCRAISIPKKSECEFIKNRDLRFECRARVK